jgi:hypothetical protein
MNRFTGMLAAALALVFCALGSRAQDAHANAGDSQKPYAVTPVPPVSSGTSYKSLQVPPVRNLTSFSLDPKQSANAKLIEFHAESEMTQPDRDLTTSAQASIRKDASLAGIEFGEGKWTYEQLVCQALPGHLFLLYRGDNGAGDVTIFSAAISRAGDGHVRIIPVQRRGFSLFSPAPVNALTIAAFNRIRMSEPANPDADWLAVALCYAALTGTHPETSPIQDKLPEPGLTLSFPPTLEVGVDGESTVRFVDGSGLRQPTEWALTFNAKGQLLKVIDSALPAYPVKLVPQLPAQQTSIAGSGAGSGTGSGSDTSTKSSQ